MKNVPINPLNNKFTLGVPYDLASFDLIWFPNTYSTMLLNPSIRDYLRFFVGQENLQVRIYSITRVTFGLRSSPFLLNETFHRHLKNLPVVKEFPEEVLKSLYVNDYVGCADRETSSFEKYGQLKSCFQDEGFNLRKCIWVTNLQTFKRSTVRILNRPTPFKKKIRRMPVHYFKIQTKPTTTSQKVLCIGWDEPQDHLVNIEYHSQAYDSIVILSPTMVLFKILFQSFASQSLAGKNHCTYMPVKNGNCWSTTYNNLSDNLSALRHYFCSVSLYQITNVQLHGFAYASDKLLQPWPTFAPKPYQENLQSQSVRSRLGLPQVTDNLSHVSIWWER